MKFKRKIYFKKIDFFDAKKKIKGVLSEKLPLLNKKSEIVKIKNSEKRITSEPVYAENSVPSFTASAMDGIAIKHRDSSFATPKKPVELTKDKDFVFINTGYPLPEKFDSIVKIEDVQIISGEKIKIFTPVPLFNHIKSIGEDIAKGEMIIPSLSYIKPETISLLFSAGIRELRVFEKMKAAVIPSGDEIISRDKSFSKNKIYETNSIFIKSYLSKWGFDVKVTDIIRDKKRKLEKVIEQCINKFDVLFFIAGSSSGSKDFIPSLVEEKGKIYFHGVNYIPGKPFCFGEIKGKPVFCLPGHPGAAIGVLNEFIKESSYFFTLFYEGETSIKAESAFKISSKLGMQEFLKVKIGKIDNRKLFYTLKRGSSMLSPFIDKDGVVEIDKNVEGINRAEKKTINIYKKKDIIDNQIVFVGSNDFLISEIRDLIRKKDYSIDIAIKNSGSLGGIQAIKNHITHFSGIHLLDEKTGEYNLIYLNKYLNKNEYKRVDFVNRKQGLLVKKDNPKGIKGIKDLLRDDVFFVNRQSGSGTRVLFDYLLKKENISKEKIKGFDRVVFTHIETGIIIKNGEADTGLGIKPVAKILNLDFIPLADEKYDLIFLKSFLKSKNYELLYEVLTSKKLKDRAEQLSGYEILI